ncbi:MAG: TetR family transcriptional regulator [Gammaproteobacteria bacterium]|nr:MAG: TetR family transcriptional regulator [Gammaproteobacteria bacterium]
MSNISKSERILDAAEELFALHGYDGVTLRKIASKAGVDVALANYHFGRKLDLFNAVLDRRAPHLNQVRLDALRSCQAQAAPAAPDLEQVLAAFLRPLALTQELETGDSGWRHYLALIAYINNSPYWGPRVMSRLFDGLVGEFIVALQNALPAASSESIYWCYQHLSGALTLTLAQTGRIDRLSGGICNSSDFTSAYDSMIPFMAAGFRKLCHNS